MFSRRCWFVFSVFFVSLAVSVPQAQTGAGEQDRPAALAQPSSDEPAAVLPQAPAAEAQDETAPGPNKHAAKKGHDKPLAPTATPNPVLWQMPENIAGLDLFYGQGGEQHQPRPPFVFLSEDMHGSNPKFDARDANHKKWRVKLGSESRPQVVASRLLWAVGYFVNDDYVIPKAEVHGLKMKRKSENQRGTEVIDARFARKPGGEKKIGIWRWKDNPFFGTREFNGLRVMMAVLNNWDLKDLNNAVFADEKNNQQIFLADDIGASFGTNGMSWTRARSKGNAASFKESKFVLRNTGTEVDFATPAAPSTVLAKSVGFGAISFVKRERLDWIGKNIPNPDAHWIGTLLGQLSHQQLVDAFRAGYFPPEEIEMYVSVLESRIAELKSI